MIYSFLGVFFFGRNFSYSLVDSLFRGIYLFKFNIYMKICYVLGGVLIWFKFMGSLYFIEKDRWWIINI